MRKLLYVEASPRKHLSRSSAAARRFLDRFRTDDPGAEIDTLDLWAESLPRFDGATLAAKYAVLDNVPHTAREAAAWREVEAVIGRFADADLYLFSVPMWNFGVPYALKHYIDIVTQPGLTFSFSPERGFRGLVTGRRAVVVYASGGDYTPGSGNPRPDLLRPFMETWLRFIGIERIDTVRVEPTIGPPTRVEAAEAAAHRQAERLARELRPEVGAND